MWLHSGRLQRACMQALDGLGGQRRAAAWPRAHLRDRIDADGRVHPGHAPPGPAPRGGPAPMVPDVPPLSEHALEELAEWVQGSRGVLVLTGAGCSTESRIPDYRGPSGAYSTGFRPMSHQQFMASPQNRARYWARSFAGWLKFANFPPNAAHESLARLEQRGWVQHLITQNVDRLHQRGGSRAVLELHGTTHEVVCTAGCGWRGEREAFQRLLEQLNPEAAAAARALAASADAERDDVERLARAGTAEPVPPGFRERAGPALQRPDGDVELSADTSAGFVVPPCPSCGGVLKPDVVFFGDAIDEARAKRSLDLAASCSHLLVVGSSLAVWSAFRLAKTAVENGAQLGILTAGPTRADDVARHKWEARAGETLARLAAHPYLLLPPAGWV